ncbi:MAG: VanZ family protein [Patescibacteria group bacterium]
MLKFLKLLLIFSWMLMIFISSHISAPPEDLTYQKKLIDYTYDKSMHLILYGMLAWLIVYFLREFKIKYRYIFYIAVITAYLYGITDEWHQSFVPGRGVSYWDLVFNVIGAMFGFIVYRLWHVVKYKRGWHAKHLHE